MIITFKYLPENQYRLQINGIDTRVYCQVTSYQACQVRINTVTLQANGVTSDMLKVFGNLQDAFTYMLNMPLPEIGFFEDTLFRS